MSKFLTNIFGSKSGPKNPTNIQARPHVTLACTNPDGRLESDALPMDDDVPQTPPNSNSNSTPTDSADMMANMVREPSADPNYSSLGEMSMPNGSITTETTNNMNVHNAQQQVVMQFSHVNQLHFGSVYNFKSDPSGQKSSACVEGTIAANAAGESRRQTPRKTTSVVVMMQSQQEPDHRLLETIATHLGDGWKLVMRNLGHSEGQIEQAIIDHQMHGGIKEVIYQLLLQWLRNAEDGEATIGRITSLLWEMNHRECVQRMKLVFKSNARQKTSS